MAQETKDSILASLRCIQKRMNELDSSKIEHKTFNEVEFIWKLTEEIKLQLDEINYRIELVENDDEADTLFDKASDCIERIRLIQCPVYGKLSSFSANNNSTQTRTHTRNHTQVTKKPSIIINGKFGNSNIITSTSNETHIAYNKLSFNFTTYSSLKILSKLNLLHLQPLVKIDILAHSNTLQISEHSFNPIETNVQANNQLPISFNPTARKNQPLAPYRTIHMPGQSCKATAKKALHLNKNASSDLLLFTHNDSDPDRLILFTQMDKKVIFPNSFQNNVIGLKELGIRETKFSNASNTAIIRKNIFHHAFILTPGRLVQANSNKFDSHGFSPTCELLALLLG